jgi:hypothetical protein
MLAWFEFKVKPTGQLWVLHMDTSSQHLSKSLSLQVQLPQYSVVAFSFVTYPRGQLYELHRPSSAQHFPKGVVSMLQSLSWHRISFANGLTNQLSGHL